VGSGCVSTQLPGLPVALPKRVLLKGLTAGWSQGSGPEPEWHQRHGKDPRGQGNQLSQRFSVRRGERAERRTESECTCSQQEVLDGWEYGRSEPGFGYAIGIPADHNEDRGRGDSAGLALMDVADDSLREPTPDVVEAACGPRLSKVLSDRTAARRLADHDEDPGPHVLGARRLCRGFKYRGDQMVLHRRVAESAAGALMVDRLEARNGMTGKTTVIQENRRSFAVAGQDVVAVRERGVRRNRLDLVLPMGLALPARDRTRPRPTPRTM
jgi:hypothetical protein